MRAFLFLLCTAFGTLLQAQNFNGCVNYNTRIEFDPEAPFFDMGLDEAAIVRIMKEKGTWIDSTRSCYGTEGYVQDIYMAMPTRSTYQRSTGLLTTPMGPEDPDLYVVTDTRVDISKKITGKDPIIETPTDTVQINGMACLEVRVIWPEGTYTYAYAPGYLPLDPAVYKDHTLDGLAAYMAIAKAVPVRITREIAGIGIAISTLARVDTTALPAAYFELPALVPDEGSGDLDVLNSRIMRVER